MTHSTSIIELSDYAYADQILQYDLEVAKPDFHGHTDGILRSLSPILSAHKHPIILVGCMAHRWMAGEGCDKLDTIDLVFRNDQIAQIVLDLVGTGYWQKLDTPGHLKRGYSEERRGIVPYDGEAIEEEPYEADFVLAREISGSNDLRYIRCWSEDSYHISVDSGSFVAVPDIFVWVACLIEEEYHPAKGREDGWWFGPRLLSDVSQEKVAVRTGHQIVVPTIPAFSRPCGRRRLIETDLGLPSKHLGTLGISFATYISRYPLKRP